MACRSFSLAVSVRPQSRSSVRRFLSAVMWAWLLSGCDDHAGSMPGADAGLSAPESATPAGGTGGGNSANGGGAPSAPGKPESQTQNDPMSSAGANGAECDLDVALLCDGDTVVESDVCAGSISYLETCETECYYGECVDCIPASGVICTGGAVHWLDSCGEVGGELEECEFGCSNGRCVAEECAPRDSFACVSNLLVAVDSCGNPGNVEQLCTDGCTDGTCEGCDTEAETICYDGDIYALDSCGHIGSRKTDCDETCRMMAGGTTACVDANDCMASQDTACALGDIHAVDSCGNIVTDVVEECPNGCDDGGCRPCEPRPVGTQCLGGSVYRLIGGCGDPPTPEDMPLQTCRSRCSAGICLDSDCATGVGRTCSQGNVHDVDSCGMVGAMLEACPNGCQSSACLPAPIEGGVGGDTSTDGGSAGNSPGASDAGLDGLGGSPIKDSGTARPLDGGPLDASTP